MKTNLTIFIFLLINSCAWGQDETPKPSHEFGVNVNSILNQFIFKKSDDVFQTAPVNQFPNLMYRFHNSRKAFRLGLGFFYNSERDTITSAFSESQNFQSIRNYSTFIGFQKTYLHQKKVNFYIGLDLKYDLEISKITQDFFFNSSEQFTNKNRVTTHSSGLGIPIGIVFHCSKRLNISTEGSIALLANLRVDKNEVNDNKQETRFINLNFNQPLSLFVNYRF